MCMLLRDSEMGYSLREGSLRQAMKSSFPRLLRISRAKTLIISVVVALFLMGLCTQCPAKSWLEHGTLDTPVEYLCEVAHAQACFLGLLQKESEHGRSQIGANESMT